MQSALSIKGWLALLCFFASSRVFTQQLQVVNDPSDPSYGTVAILGLGQEALDLLKNEKLYNSQWSSFFQVRVQEASRNVAGKYAVDLQSITFKPRFVPDSKVDYEIIFFPSALGEVLGIDLEMGERQWLQRFEVASEKGSVISIYPAENIWPENILRIYLYFSSPMGFANPHEFIKLVNSSDSIVREPFVEVKEGLWNSDKTRLTLFFHPGRIKRNVGPNETVGPVLIAGERYKIRISKEMKTAAGSSLAEDYVWQFSVGPSVRDVIDFNEWKVNTPTAFSSEELIIKVNEPLDQALVSRMLSIQSGERVLSGQFDYDGLSEVTFKPDQAWELADYIIKVDKRLEDVCGNTINQPFDLEGSSQKKVLKDGTIQFQTIR